MSVNIRLPETSLPQVSLTAETEQRPLSRIPARVALLTNCIAPYSVPMLRHLTKNLAELDILVSTPMEQDRHWQPVWDGLNVKVQKSFTFTHQRAFRQGYRMSFIRHFPYDSLPWLRRLQPDVIISAQLGFRTAQAVAYRKFNPALRLVVWVDASEHTEREIGPVRTRMRQALLRSADAVLVNGASGERYVASLGIPAARIVRAPYSTDMTPFAQLPLARDQAAARRLLYVGQLVESKGLEGLLRSLADWSVRHPEEKRELWLLGDGPLRSTLANFPVGRGITLRFFGNVPYADLSAFHAQCGILVFPTLSDTWGLVVNEALASGLPVFGSCYSQAVQELIRDGENGWTYHPDCSEELDGQLERMLAADAVHLMSMRSAARRSIAHLTPQFAASRFLQAIRVAQAC